MDNDNIGPVIARVQQSDLPEILELQKSSFYTEAAFYNNFNIPPMNQTIEEITEEFKKKIFLKAMTKNSILGSVRGSLASGDNKTCVIERLFVSQDFRNMGIGYMLLTAIQEAFPKAKRFELATGKLSAKNIHLYEKAGFKIYREERISKIPMVFMEKC